MLPIVLNPYELHARSVCASAALLIGAPVITLLPAPLEGVAPAQIARAIYDSPGFERLMDKWRWAGPLWRHGALTAGLAGVTPIDCIQRAAADIVANAHRSPAARTLANLVGETRFNDTPLYLEAVCRDLERGGGDPAVSVPIGVGLESYAAALAAPVAASPTESVVSRIEQHRQRPLLRLTTTVVHGASGELLLELRDALSDELDALRRALRGALDARSPRGEDDVRGAAEELDRAVADLADVTLGPRDPDEPRVRGGVRRLHVALTFGLDRPGGALAAAQQAAAVAVRTPRTRSATPGEHRAGVRHGGPDGHAASPTTLTARPVLRLTIKELHFESRFA